MATSQLGAQSSVVHVSAYNSLLHASPLASAPSVATLIRYIATLFGRSGFVCVCLSVCLSACLIFVCVCTAGGSIYSPSVLSASAIFLSAPLSLCVLYCILDPLSVADSLSSLLSVWF